MFFKIICNFFSSWLASSIKVSQLVLRFVVSYSYSITAEGSNPNGLRPPPPSFLENYIANFYDRYGCIYTRSYDGWIVWNACTGFPDIGVIQYSCTIVLYKCTIYRYRCDTIQLYNFIVQVYNCNTIQCWKQHTLNPEITILSISIFWSKSPV